MRKYAFLILVLAVVLCGCKGNNFIGKWNISGMPVPIPGATMTADFTSSDVFFNLDIPQANVKQKFVGTYKLEGDIMTTNFTDWVIDGQGPQVEASKKMVDAMKPKLLEAMNKDPKATVKWDGKDSFTMTGTNDKTLVTFTRIK